MKFVLVVLLFCCSLVGQIASRELVRGGDPIKTQAPSAGVAAMTEYGGRDGVLFRLTYGVEYVSFDGATVVRFAPDIEADVSSKHLVWMGRVASDGKDVYFVYKTPNDRVSPMMEADYYLVRYGIEGKYKGITPIDHDFMYCCDIVAMGSDSLFLSGTHLMYRGGPEASWDSYHEMTWMGRFGTDGSHIASVTLPGDEIPKDGKEAEEYVTGCFVDRDDYGNVVIARPYGGKAWVWRLGHDPEELKMEKSNESTKDLLSVKIHAGQVAAIYLQKTPKVVLTDLEVYGDKGSVVRRYYQVQSDIGLVVADWDPNRLLMTSYYEVASGEHKIQFTEWLQK